MGWGGVGGWGERGSPGAAPCLGEALEQPGAEICYGECTYGAQAEPARHVGLERFLEQDRGQENREGDIRGPESVQVAQQRENALEARAAEH